MKFLGFLLLVISLNTYAKSEVFEYKCNDYTVLMSTDTIDRKMTILKGDEVVATQGGLIPTFIFNDFDTVGGIMETSLNLLDRSYYFTEIEMSMATPEVPGQKFPSKWKRFYRLAIFYMDMTIQAKAGKSIDCTEVTSKK